jgi:hypothetical protein
MQRKLERGFRQAGRVTGAGRRGQQQHACVKADAVDRALADFQDGVAQVARAGQRGLGAAEGDRQPLTDGLDNVAIVTAGDIVKVVTLHQGQQLIGDCVGADHRHRLIGAGAAAAFAEFHVEQRILGRGAGDFVHGYSTA